MVIRLVVRLVRVELVDQQLAVRAGPTWSSCDQVMDLAAMLLALFGINGIDGMSLQTGSMGA